MENWYSTAPAVAVDVPVAVVTRTRVLPDVLYVLPPDIVSPDARVVETAVPVDTPKKEVRVLLYV
jgi:hypothetical protein